MVVPPAWVAAALVAAAAAAAVMAAAMVVELGADAAEGAFRKTYCTVR